MTHLCLQLYLYIHTVHPFMWISTSLCNFSLQGGWLQLIFFGIFGQRLHDVHRLHSQFCSILFPLFATNVCTGAPRCSTVLSGVWVETPVLSLQPIWGLLGHSTDLENQFCGTSCDARLSRPCFSVFFWWTGDLPTTEGVVWLPGFFYGVQYRRQVGDVDVDSLTFSSMATEVFGFVLLGVSPIQLEITGARKMWDTHRGDWHFQKGSTTQATSEVPQTPVV